MHTIENEANKIISARIIDLENKKLKLLNDLKPMQNEILKNGHILKLEYKERLYQDMKPLNARLVIIEKMINFNKMLLGYNDDHNYQLES